MPRRIEVSALFAALFAGLVLAGTTAAANLTQTESNILGAVNEARAAHGLRPLSVDGHLERAARAHSSEMMHTGSFSHGSFSSRVRAYGAKGPVLGENLAWSSVGAAVAWTIVHDWLASPEHRANLLRPGYRRIGVGAMLGQFLGYQAVVVTADFGGS